MLAMAGESSLRLSLCLLHPSWSVFEARQVLLSLLRPVTLFHPFPAVQPWGTPSASTSTLRPLGALLLPAFCSALAPRRQLPVSSRCQRESLIGSAIPLQSAVLPRLCVAARIICQSAPSPPSASPPPSPGACRLPGS